MTIPESPSRPLSRTSESEFDAAHYRRQLETVARNATLALFIMDERQHCTYMNPAAEAMTGFSLAELRDKPLHDYIHHTRPDGSHYPLSECPIDQAFPKNMQEQGEEVFVHKDGHLYPVEFTASPIMEGGEPVGTIIEVRETAEEKRALREKEQLLGEIALQKARLDSVFSQAPSLIAVVEGEDHVFRLANPSYREILGGRDVVGLPAREALPEFESQGFLDLLDEAYRTGKTYEGREVQAYVRRGDDQAMEQLYVNFVYQPLFDQEGNVTGVLIHGVDVTELVRSRMLQEDQAAELEEQAVELEAQTEDLREQAIEMARTRAKLEVTNEELQRANAAAEFERSRLAAVVEHAPVGIVIAEAPSGRIVMGNRRVEEIFRHPVLSSTNVDEYQEWVAYHPDGSRVQGHEYPLARAITTGEVAGPDEYHYQRGDGERVWIQITGAPIRDSAGNIEAALVTIVDIDQQKRAAKEREELLQRVDEERRLLQEVFENAPAVMALYSGPDHIVELVNPTWEKTVGKPDAVGKPFKEVFPEFEASGLFDILDRVYQTGQPFADHETHVPLERWGGGVLEDTVWDLLWLPLAPRPDGSRDILVHAVEMTEQIRSREQVSALARAALAVHSAPSIEEVLKVTTEEARNIIGAHQSVASLTTDKRWSQAINAVSLSEKYSRWSDYSVPPDGTGIYTVVCQTNQPMRMTQAELEEHTGWKGFGDEAPNHPPMRGWLAAPLIGRDGRNLGLIQLSDRYNGEFTAQDEAVLVQLAQIASVAIENTRLYEEALKANEVKAGFLATMSHELRTPLNAMIGYAELLELGVPDAISEASQRQVERIRLSAQHLLQLIEEILTFSRVEAGRERLDVDVVPLGVLVAEVEAIVEPLARDKNLDFRVDGKRQKETITTDPRKVRQILLNLLGNAVKFTNSGFVAFKVNTTEAGFVRFEVEDTGIGISPEDVANIYEPFWQAESEIHSRVSGTGLGLSVTRQLVELLGGTIEVNSGVGEGTRFVVRMPLLPPEPAEKKEED